MTLFFGILGLILLLLAFVLDTFNVVSEKSRLLYGLNFVGSVLLVWYSYEIRSVPFFILESFWVCVSLIKMLKQKWYAHICKTIFLRIAGLECCDANRIICFGVFFYSRIQRAVYYPISDVWRGRCVRRSVGAVYRAVYGIDNFGRKCYDGIRGVWKGAQLFPDAFGNDCSVSSAYAYVFVHSHPGQHLLTIN